MSLRNLAVAATGAAAMLTATHTVYAAPTSDRLATLALDGAETVAYDSAQEVAFVSSAGAVAVHAVDLSDPAAPTLIESIDLSPYGGSVQSVAVGQGLLAVAVAAVVPQDEGSVVFFRTADRSFVADVTTGALPDDLKFTPDGTKVVTANEGEPNADYSVDPLGSISVIPVIAGTPGAATTVDFTSFEAQRAALVAQGLRVFGPAASLASDLEPEYVTIAPNSTTAYVTLQENNAIAVVNLSTPAITAIRPLGVKDHSAPGNEIDASDRDAVSGNLDTWPVYGMYMPDQAALVGGYLITANEGDARDYDTFGEEARVATLTLDPTAFPDAVSLQDETALGRLVVSSVGSDPDDDGDADVLYSYGARSISVWTPNGALVWDSGSELEREVLSRASSSWDDGRSDNKGPEPEGIVSGVVDGETYVYVALERTSGVAVWKVTNPLAPVFQGILQPADTDESPEGMAFVSIANSPTDRPLLLVANEGSGTLAVWAVGSAATEPEPPTLPETGSSLFLAMLAAGAVVAGGALLRLRRV